MQLNWMDIALIAFFVYAAVDGWQRGFIALVANFVSFLGSLWFAVHFHTAVGNFFQQKFGLTTTWTNVTGYLVVAVFAQACLEIICQIAMEHLPAKLFTSRVNSWLGSIVSVLNIMIVAAFVLLLLLALPLRGTIKTDIQHSPVSKFLVTLANTYGGQVSSSVDSIAQNASKFLTVEPGSQESIPLDLPLKLPALTVDPASEQSMVVLVNKERTSRGLAELSTDATLTRLAEDKSRDMFVRHYFSHYDPDRKNEADYLNTANVPYTVAGENLAYAPDLATAHQGLMNSAGHRANILDTRYHKIGIGIIDAGIYGKMFTQEFTD